MIAISNARPDNNQKHLKLEPLMNNIGHIFAWFRMKACSIPLSHSLISAPETEQPCRDNTIGAPRVRLTVVKYNSIYVLCNGCAIQVDHSIHFVFSHETEHRRTSGSRRLNVAVVCRFWDILVLLNSKYYL